jgi:hypothetical protein
MPLHSCALLTAKPPQSGASVTRDAMGVTASTRNAVEVRDGGASYRFATGAPDRAHAAQRVSG